MRHSRLLVWRRPRNDLWNNTYVCVLRKPGQCCVQVWIGTCERRWTRAVSPRQRTLVPRCERVSAVAKLDTRKRDVDSAMRSAAIVARLDISGRCADNVRKSAGKSSPSSSSGKSSGKGGTTRGSRDKCYCCGQVGHRRPDCPRRNESCSLSGKRGHLSQVCRSSHEHVSARAVEVERAELGEERNPTRVGTVILRHFWNPVGRIWKPVEHDHGLWC